MSWLSSFRFERTVPLVIVCSFVGYSLFAVWTVSKFDSHLSDHEQRIAKLEEKSSVTSDINVKLSAMDAKLQILLNLAGLDGNYNGKPRIH